MCPLPKITTQIKARAEEGDGAESSPAAASAGGGSGGGQKEKDESGESVVITFEVSPADAHIALFVVATSVVGGNGGNGGGNGVGKVLKVRESLGLGV